MPPTGAFPGPESLSGLWTGNGVQGWAGAGKVFLGSLCVPGHVLGYGDKEVPEADRHPAAAFHGVGEQARMNKQGSWIWVRSCKEERREHLEGKVAALLWMVREGLSREGRQS